jgi:hypothetical protein
MGDQFYRSGTPSGFQYGTNNIPRDKIDTNDIDSSRKNKDEDLIIEENTVYEIDRECYERLRRQRRRKEQDGKSKKELV